MAHEEFLHQRILQKILPPFPPLFIFLGQFLFDSWPIFYPTHNHY